MGAPGPPTGEIWGVKVSTSPPSPSNSLRQISGCRRSGAGLVPGYNPRDFGKSAGNVAGDIFTFIWSPGPRYIPGAQTYKTESFILLDTPPQVGAVTVMEKFTFEQPHQAVMIKDDDDVIHLHTDGVCYL